MLRKTMTCCAIILMLISGAAMAQEEDAAKEKSAVEAAEKWLQLIDNTRYANSWKEAATHFKNAISKEKWEQMMNGVRWPFGKQISRKLIKATYATTLPGAPDGEYYVIEFESSFENKKSCKETVTPLLDEDGKWHVSGYYIN